MSVSLEQIEMLKERANISYGEAKEILEKSNGDILEALINLEKESKLKTPQKEKECCPSGFWTTTKKLTKTGERLIKKGNEIKFVIRKAENTVVDLPLNVVLLVTVITPPVTLVGVLAAFVTNHKIRLVKPDGEDMGINRTFDKISSAVNSVSNQVTEAINKN